MDLVYLVQFLFSHRSLGGLPMNILTRCCMFLLHNLLVVRSCVRVFRASGGLLGVSSSL